MKYIVMECHMSYAVLLDEEGRFRKAANLHYETGETVTNPVLMQEDERKSLSPARMARRGAAAAGACLLLFLLAGGYYRSYLAPYTSVLLASCEYFTVHEMEISEKAALCADETSFHFLLVLDGSLTLSMDGEEMALKKGDSVFIPAGAGNYVLTGKARLVHTAV